jgi:hypothetical protein
LRHWQQDPDLASVRDENMLGKLPQDEREEWRKLWEEVATQLARLDDRLPAILDGKDQPRDARECLGFAFLCHKHRQRHAAAVRFCVEAFDAQPALAEDLQAGHRYNAACAAALAGCGQGKDAPPGDEQRARLRRRALRWLRADLAAWAKLADKGPPAGRAAAQRTLAHWQKNPDLAGLRDKDALDELPAGERDACRKLWANVADLLRQAEGRARDRPAP